MNDSERIAIINNIELEIPRLRRFARYLVRNPEYADDLVQDCLLRAIENIDSWQQGTNLRAWLFVILKNIFRNDLRKSSREVPKDFQSEDELTITVPASQDARIALLEVREAFLKLSDEHKEVLLLVAIEGLTYEEAGLVLDIPVGTIRSRLSRARNLLRDQVDRKKHVSQPGAKERNRV